MLTPVRAPAKGKLQRLSLEKVRLKLEALAASILKRDPQASASERRKVAVVVLSGPFNPPHSGHQASLEAAARAVKARSGIPVVAGFYNPMPDREAIRSTTDEEVEPFLERCVLCRLAVAASSWIDVCEWGWSDERVSYRMGQELEQSFAWTGGLRWDFQVWHVAGSTSQLVAHLKRRQFPSICVAGQSPHEPFLARCLAAGAAPGGAAQSPATAWRARRYGPRGVLLGGRACAAGEASSEELRSLVAAGSWDELESRGWLAEAVLQRLKGPPRDPQQPGALPTSPEEAPEPAQADLRPQEEGEAPRAPSKESAASSSDQAAAPPTPPDDEEATAQGKVLQPAKVVIEPPSGGPIDMSAARVRKTNGNAAKASMRGGRKVIAHICNDQGNGGRGFFQDIKQEWGGGPSRAYFEWHRDRGSNDFRIGAVQFVEVSRLVEVATIIGEAGHKAGSRGAPMRLDAIEEALQALGRHAAACEASVHMPRMIRGGEWDKIAPLLKKMSAAHGVEVFVYGKS